MSATAIKKVGVIGAGLMGSGIAAQIANAGVPVILLDIVPEGAKDRNQLANGALAAMAKADPAPLMHRGAAKLITSGNLDDHLALLADCDWIVEVVVERPSIKQALYAKLETVRKATAVVSSNTSTIPLSMLVAGRSPEFTAHFMITHFFNPPRYMRLMELVRGPTTDHGAADAIRDFADHRLGKTVVEAKDRPGFIANRLGTLWIQSAINNAFDLGLTIEEADLVVGRPMGIPKTGVFGLLDLVGIDLMPHVNASLVASLPKDDPFQALQREQPLITGMIAKGLIGRKGKGGFYALDRKGTERVKMAIDLKTGEYRKSEKARLDSVEQGGKSLAKLVSHPDRGGRYARAVLLDTLSYAAYLVPEVTDDIHAIDDGMRLGYAWKFGPFELIDQLGPGMLVKALKADGRTVPPFLEKLGDAPCYRIENGKLQRFALDGAYHDIVRPAGVLLLADVKRAGKPLLKNGSAALWDIGDGVACFEFTSKMNSIDPDLLGLLGKSIGLVAQKFKAMVIYNEGSNFSVGANLGLAMFAVNICAWDQVKGMVELGQGTYRALREAPFPVVGAPSGMALGGGCEILMHCRAIQAHSESYVGLVEVGVGLLPGWGGCATLLGRWIEAPGMPKGPMPAIGKAFEMISTAKVAKSAFEAKEMMLLPSDAAITMNRDRLLFDAKAKAVAMVEGHQAPARRTYRLPGPTGVAALSLALDGFLLRGDATPHDRVVCLKVAEVLTGGSADVTEETSEDALLELERTHFMSLIRHPDSMARIEHMLETGKPLRN